MQHPVSDANPLRRLRLARKLTTVRLAQLTGLDRATVWRIETGQVVPNRATLLFVASALDADPADLIEVAVRSEDGR